MNVMEKENGENQIDQFYQFIDGRILSYEEVEDGHEGKSKAYGMDELYDGDLDYKTTIADEEDKTYEGISNIVIKNEDGKEYVIGKNNTN